ncbi:MAG: PLP-dependent aminotransferase family protein [Vicinamibacterales bacterium]
MARRSTLPMWNVLALNRAAPATLQDQLVAFFRDAVLAGALKPGARVPSSRLLAAEQGIARITAVEAYDRLMAEGYLVSRRGVGLFVAASLRHARVDGPRRPTRRQRGGSLADDRRRVGGSPASARDRHDAGTILPLATGLPALDEFPWHDWTRISGRVHRERSTAALAYGDPQGLAELRTAIAEYLGAARGIVCDADQVVIVSGAQQGIDLTARSVAAPADRVWVEEPGYATAREALAAARLDVVAVPADAAGIDVAAGVRLAPTARLAVVTPSYHYPLGGTLSLPRRIDLLAWAHRSAGWILEDDYYGEYRFAGRPLAPLHTLDRHARVLYLGTFSKILAPGLRLGYLVVPPHLVGRVTDLKRVTDRYAPGLTQLVLARFIAEGRLAAHVRRMRALYRERRSALLAALARYGADVLDVGEPPDAGLHLAARLRVDVDDDVVSRRVRSRGVQATALSTYYARAPRARGFVLGFANTAEPAIGPAVHTLAATIRLCVLEDAERRRR